MALDDKYQLISQQLQKQQDIWQQEKEAYDKERSSLFKFEWGALESRVRGVC